MKFYRGSAAGARAYVEAGRSRADEYYLAEGEGIAARYAAGADGRVAALGGLDGDAYEAWVAGFDPDTGVARGRVREDANALRFCEVVVNGPKSWSLAAEVHPEIAAAYDAAQARAAEQVVGWFAANASTRVGPRGGQVSTPVERVEACAVAHRTSRCGDPHRHVHVQVNARVFAAGGWRGIDSVAVRDSIAAAQGIGHAAVACDPGFRAALAAHGYTLDRGGEIVELAGFVAALSKRHAQIEAAAAGFEAEWRAANPGVEPGKGLRRGWDTRAWAADRPDKPTVEAGVDLAAEWRGRLVELGWRAPDRPVDLVAPAVGRLDRDRAAHVVLARVGAARSGFNAADVRGEVEALLARTGIVVAAGVRAEVAEDVAARAMGLAVPLLGERAVPGHVRAFTTREALAVETELVDRFAGRAAADAVGGRDAAPEVVDAAAAAAGVALDAGQAQAVAALAGEHALTVVAGAAGAGKTTMLAATRAAVEVDGHVLTIVTPTLKAARGAAAETGAATGSASWLVHQHGWRWDHNGVWTRLAVGDADPKGGKTYAGPGEGARLARGGLLVVDEAGMLDQDTASALLVVADEAGVRLGLVGDARQLPAVGRGGVLDAAERWTQRRVALDVVHRFAATVEIEPGVWADVPDRQYAELSLVMRQGAAGDPGAVFDALHERGQVQVHATEAERRAAVAERAAAAVLAGQAAAVSVATNEAARELNVAIRDRLVAAGLVQDATVATTDAGQRIGVEDTVVTRQNDRNLDVANRDVWTVTAVGADGGLVLAAPPGSGQSGERALPAEYVHDRVELGYATTVHGVQGATAHTGHLVLDEHTSAAAAYVGMTRGRTANTVHLVAADVETARARWVQAAGRGRADLGPAAAREAAGLAADRYPGQQAHAQRQAERLAEIREQLRAGWAEQDAARARVAALEPRVAAARADAERAAAAEPTLAPLRETADTARERAEALAGPAAAAQDRLEKRGAQIREHTREAWERDREPARAAARTVQEGSGRFGRLTGGRGEVEAAREHLHRWAGRWSEVLPDLRPETAWARAIVHPGNDRVEAYVDRYAAATAAAQLPDRVQAVTDWQAVAAAADHAIGVHQRAETTARQERAQARGFSGDTGERLAELAAAFDQAQQRVRAVTAGLERLVDDPAVTAVEDPGAWLEHTRLQWNTDRNLARAAAALRQTRADRERDRDHYRAPDHGRGRDGPDLGR